MNTLYSCLYVIGCIIIIMCWTVARGMKVRCVRNFRWISRSITLILTYFYRFQFLTVSILFDSRRISFRNWQPQLKWTTIKIFLRHQRNVRDMLSRRYGLAHKPVVGGSASSCYDCQGLVQEMSYSISQLAAALHGTCVLFAIMEQHSGKLLQKHRKCLNIFKKMILYFVHLPLVVQAILKGTWGPCRWAKEWPVVSCSKPRSKCNNS